MFDLEIVNTKIVTATNEFNASISIKDGKIAAISKHPLNKAHQTIKADGLVTLPGMIDQHVHFMDPGETDREDFLHGSKAAATGGVTTVIEHTHAFPVRNVKTFDEKINHLKNRSYVDFGLTAHVFPEDLGYLHELWDRGIMMFKMFTCTTHGIPTLSNDDLYRALQEIASFDGLALVHCEDDSITAGNEKRLKDALRNDFGIISEWRSESAEQIAVATVALMARLTNAKTTIAHISHPLIVELIKREQQEGARLYGEMCPQYLFLNDEIVKEKGPFAKFTPPARSKEKSHELRKIFQEGHLQLLSSDHAPSTVEQKLEGNIWDCNFGLPGVETTLPMMLSLVNDGEISLQDIVKIYSENPAKILGLYPKKGNITVGVDADFVLIDMKKKWTIRNENIVSKAGWTPFDGKEITGKPMYTIVRGNIVLEDGKINDAKTYGQPLNK